MSRESFGTQYATTVIIDGVTSTDLGQDFAYRAVFPDQVVSVLKGTQGARHNVATDKTCELELSCLPESAVIDQLYDVYYNQTRGRARQIDITIISSVGENLTFNKCLVKKNGDIEDGGPEGVARVFTFSVLEFQHDKSNVN